MAGTYLTFCDFAGKNLPLGNRPGCYADFLCNNVFPPQLCCTEGEEGCFGESPVITTETIEVTIGSDPLISSAEIWIHPSDYNSLTDVLLFSTLGPISGVFDVPSGVLTLTGNDTAANYQIALRSVTYQYTP